MRRDIKDQAYSSAKVGGPQSPVGGSGFQSAPSLEPIDARVIDNRAAGSAALVVGNVMVEQMLQANSGDANYGASAVANQALPMFSYGIITAIPIPSIGAAANPPSTTGGGNEVEIRQKGTCSAFATSTANANKAIAVSDPLCLDGAGNLTSAPANPPAGTVVAIAKQALAGGTAAATLIEVTVGGY